MTVSDAAKKSAMDIFNYLKLNETVDATIVLDIQSAIDTATADLRKQLADKENEIDTLKRDWMLRSNSLHEKLGRARDARLYRQLADAQAEIERLREVCALNSDILRSMLCTPTGVCCITGSDADRRLVAECIDKLALAGGEE